MEAFFPHAGKAQAVVWRLAREKPAGNVLPVERQYVPGARIGVTHRREVVRSVRHGLRLRRQYQPGGQIGLPPGQQPDLTAGNVLLWDILGGL